VSKDIIERESQEFDLESKENTLIHKLIEKKQRSVERYPKEKQYEKIVAFLLRKGFGYDDVKKALEAHKK
jgi:SOS response regulatory protein OraA/RecX